MKKLIAMLLVLVMVLSMVACGAKEEPAAPEAAPEAAEKEPVVLEMMVHHSEGLVKAIEELNAKFTEEYPWITVNLSTAAGGDYYSGMQPTRIEAGDIDIMEAGGGYLTPEWVVGAEPTKSAQYANDGILMDLTGQDFIANWSEASIALQNTHSDGKVYSLPTGSFATNGVFYSKAIFADLGLSEPKTWDEFIALCKTLQENGIAPLTCGIKDVWPQAMFFDAIATSVEADPQQFVKDLWSGDRTFNDAQTMKIWNRIDEITPYWEEGVAAVDYATAISRFVTGKAAMLADGTWTSADLVNADPEFEFGYFAIPGDEAPADGGDVQLRGKFDATFAGFAGSKHPEEVMLWFEFYSRPENYAAFADTLGIQPAQNGLSLENPFLNSLSGKLVDFGEHFESMFYKPEGTGQYANNRFAAASNLPVYGGDIATIQEIADLAASDWALALEQIQ